MTDLKTRLRKYISQTIDLVPSYRDLSTKCFENNRKIINELFMRNKQELAIMVAFCNSGSREDSYLNNMIQLPDIIHGLKHTSMATSNKLSKYKLDRSSYGDRQ